MRTAIAILAAAIAGAASQSLLGATAAADPTKEQLEFFESKIRPVLAENCYKCHSLERGKAKGDLTLDSRDAVLKGGENGPAIHPGEPDRSLLIKAISYDDKDLQMPPKGDKLTKEQIADLTAWVKMGAPDPRKDVKAADKLSGLTDKARSHWAYQPVKKPAIPVTKNRAWCVTPVDAFVLAKMEEKGMVPSPLAEPETLLRRATYDLIGMPPTPQEVLEFQKDHSPQAFAKVVDRLLASPHYGERWGRFWLDTARYADTTGDRENNMSSDYRYPYAWTYRDYVVRAFNEDKPYDRFVLEQLAADKLPDLKDSRDLAALGFLTVGERFGNPNDVINDRIDAVSKGFLGMTVTCARCHDHMFDPISTKDYYAMHGVFASTVEPHDKPVITPAKNKSMASEFEGKITAYEQENRDIYYKLASEYNALFRQKAAFYIKAAFKRRDGTSAEDQLKAQAIIRDEKLDTEVLNYVGGRITSDDPAFKAFKRFLNGGDTWKELAKTVSNDKGINPLIAKEFVGKVPKDFEEIADIVGKVFASVEPKGQEFVAASAAVKTKADKLAGFEPPVMELLQVPFRVNLAVNLTTEQVRNEINGWPQNIRNKGKFNFARINELQLTHDGADARAMVVADSQNPRDSSVFIRGQAEMRGDVVPRRFIEVLTGGKSTPFKLGSGRLELAQAIASKTNPLTARVIVNRVWMHHFGDGFVRTPDDLGTQSEAPSHPELLDYLCAYFMDQGWSMKKLHKLIMLSKVYQESSYTIPAHAQLDPDNRFLWRANVRRLEFESMRDSLLVFSGLLDRTVGGQPVNLTDEPYSYRRSVYGYIDRGNLPDLMAHFDFSDPDMPNSKRSSTVVPQQALYLMNSPMAVETARRIIARPEVTNSTDNLNKIFNIYRVIFQRNPKPAEIQMALNFVGKEVKEEPKIAASAKETADKAGKDAAEKEKNGMAMMGNNDGERAIRNQGKFVERKPLTPWETYAQALILSNEAAYVN